MRILHSKKTSVKSAKSTPALHSAFDGLDGRFSFDLDDEFEIYLDTLAKPIRCYTTDSMVFGDGAGLTYSVAVAVPREDIHWQIQEDIERNLEKYIKEQTAGTDYTGWVEDMELGMPDQSDIADDVFDNCEIYVYDVCVIPYQNISPWGDYGIDYGTEEYLDHVTKGTPWPPEYED